MGRPWQREPPLTHHLPTHKNANAELLVKVTKAKGDVSVAEFVRGASGDEPGLNSKRNLPPPTYPDRPRAGRSVSADGEHSEREATAGGTGERVNTSRPLGASGWGDGLAPGGLARDRVRLLSSSPHHVCNFTLFASVRSVGATKLPSREF